MGKWAREHVSGADTPSSPLLGRLFVVLLVVFHFSVVLAHTFGAQGSQRARRHFLHLLAIPAKHALQRGQRAGIHNVRAHVCVSTSANGKLRYFYTMKRRLLLALLPAATLCMHVHPQMRKRDRKRSSMSRRLQPRLLFVCVLCHAMFLGACGAGLLSTGNCCARQCKQRQRATEPHC